MPERGLLEMRLNAWGFQHLDTRIGAGAKVVARRTQLIRYYRTLGEQGVDLFSTQPQPLHHSTVTLLQTSETAHPISLN
jgi:hypothetical protein